MKSASGLAFALLAASACDPRRTESRTKPLPPLRTTVSDAGARRAIIDVVIDCNARTKPIHPGIYGIGYDLTRDEGEARAWQWRLGPSGRRFGGNASSRYNWELGTWNHGSDWLFANDGTPPGMPLYERFLREDDEKGVGSAVTIPILGWVAKDRTSVSFPLSRYPHQKSVDEARGAGDGQSPTGRLLPSPSEADTSVVASPEMEGRWVKTMAFIGPTPKHAPRVYILDNEPGLWNATHRDVHPGPVSYDELLARTIAYATEIRKNDPSGLIAGPAAYGWPDYFYSAKDAELGYRVHLDRRLHGDLPLLAYYLRELHDHEQRTGERLLDLLDVHFYPQSEDVGVGTRGGVDPKTAAMRIRSARALWDPSYVDESWIHEPVRLLPRLREWIDQYDPGVGIEIGEWNYGAEGDMSGGLATAETLGRFADAGVAQAFYWTYPPEGSPAFFAFRAFRNFDGHGGRFENELVPIAAPGEGASVWASRDASGKHVVVVILGFSPELGLDARVHVSSCGHARDATEYVYTSGATDFAVAPLPGRDGDLALNLPPYSMTTVDIHLD